MAAITYNIDKTETEYIHFDGKSIQELKAFIYSDKNFEDCCGTITYEEDKRKASIAIASVHEYGVYIGYSNSEHIYLSLSDKTKLCKVIDVWGDGLFVSEGLFISPQLAWKCICELIETGDMCKEVDWITSDELPEEGNYI